jgi:predicted phage-related endonuclease
VKEKIKRLNEIRQEISKLYKEKEELEQKVIDAMVELGDKNIPFNDFEVLTLAWVFDKKIDYERLKALYPEVYELGLTTTFSTNQALRSMDTKFFNLILKDCLSQEPHYVVKYKPKKYQNRKKG